MLKVYTDGCCKGNPGPGAWAFVVFNKNMEYKGHKKAAKKGTTNNEMELMALAEALNWVYRNGIKCEIYTDSSYVHNGITNWMHSWARNGWKNSKNEVVKNKDLWVSVKSLWSEVYGSVSLNKVKGHSGDKGNDMADMYCNEAWAQEFL